MKPVEYMIYGHMPNNELSVAEHSEFRKQLRKVYSLSAPVLYMDNVDHLPYAEAYKAVGTFRSSYGNQSGPKGAGTASNFASHMKMWEHIVETYRAAACLESDARVMRNFTQNLYIPDHAIVCLGPRVESVDSYVAPDDPFTLVDIPRHAGSHAYAITPVTAGVLLETVYRFGVFDSIDQMLFMNGAEYTMKTFYPELEYYALDPPPVVSVWGNKNGVQKESSIGRSAPGANFQPTYNFYTTVGFERGKQ